MIDYLYHAWRKTREPGWMRDPVVPTYPPTTPLRSAIIFFLLFIAPIIVGLL